MNKKKICVITSSRAEYGLLYWIMKQVEASNKLKLQLIVTGMHLSHEFGLFIKEIKKEFKVDKKIEILLSSDTSISISKSMGLCQISFSEAYDELKPDMILVLGDRYEIFSAAASAMVANIPIAHIHGGELTLGAFDDSFRHSITKMSHLHFTATKEYKKRVVQLGEDPGKVYNVGGLGVENIKRNKILNKNEFEKSINFKLNTKNILVTFHPVTLENKTSKKQFQELLDAIEKLKDTNFIFTKSNSDTDGRIINKMIDKYVERNPHKAVAFFLLGQSRYMSALKYVDAIIGNSSSGLLEAPSFKIGTVNIGDRQKGRIKAKSVIDCLANKKDIKKAIDKIYSKKFQKLLKNVKNPYSGGKTSKKIVNILKKISFPDSLKKKFYDIKV